MGNFNVAAQIQEYNNKATFTFTSAELVSIILGEATPIIIPKQAGYLTVIKSIQTSYSGTTFFDGSTPNSPYLRYDYSFVQGEDTYFYLVDYLTFLVAASKKSDSQSLYTQPIALWSNLGVPRDCVYKDIVFSPQHIAESWTGGQTGNGSLTFTVIWDYLKESDLWQ